MRSLRARLVVPAALGMAVLLAAAGGVVYALVRAGMVAQLDESIVDRARLFASVVEQEDDKIDLEFDELDLAAYRKPEGPGFLWLRQEGGDVLYCSPSLAGRDLAPTPPATAEPTCRWIVLAGGRPGRAVAVTFLPRREGHEDEPDEPEAHTAPTTVRITLVLAWDASPTEEALAALRDVLVVVGVLAVGGSAGLLWVVIRRGLAPLGRLAGRIAVLDETRLADRVPTGAAPAEVRPVVARLNGLLERLDAAFARERGFSADVAHELRTPLAGLRTTLEVAAARPRTATEYAETLADCQGIVDRMTGMVEQLLTLARLESGQAEVSPEPVAVEALAREAWQALAPRAEQRGLRVRWDCAACPPLRTDRRLLQRIVANLLDNAVAHADEGGAVDIKLRQAPDGVVFRIVNSGCTLSAEEAGRVFDRFWRGDAARTGDGHCGLGLALARRAAEVLGGAIGADVRGGHFAVELRVPSLATPQQVGAVKK